MTFNSGSANSDCSTVLRYLTAASWGVALPPQPYNGYRDIRAYLDAKLAHSPNDPGVRDLVAVALRACRLDDTDTQTSTLDRPEHHDRLVAAAAVVAASVIRQLPFSELALLYTRLQQSGAARARAELQSLLAFGDEERPPGHPYLTLKNFTSAGLDKVTYVNKTVSAYSRAADLLLQASNALFRIRPRHWWVGRKLRTAFRRYFGDMNAQVPSVTMTAGNRLVGPWNHLNFVQNVLAEVHDVMRNEPVRIYYGGKSMKGDSIAYARNLYQLPSPSDPLLGRRIPRVHLDTFFFRLDTDRRARTLIHEMTHAVWGTYDHAYEENGCARLAAIPSQALGNADSYAYFIRDAFC